MVFCFRSGGAFFHRASSTAEKRCFAPVSGSPREFIRMFQNHQNLMVGIVWRQKMIFVTFGAMDLDLSIFMYPFQIMQQLNKILWAWFCWIKHMGLRLAVLTHVMWWHGTPDSNRDQLQITATKHHHSYPFLPWLLLKAWDLSKKSQAWWFSTTSSMIWRLPGLIFFATHHFKAGSVPGSFANLRGLVTSQRLQNEARVASKDQGHPT